MVAKRYEIVVTEIEVVNYTAKEYQKVAETGNTRDGGPCFGYVETSATKESRREVFKQLVDDETFNLWEIVAAANGQS